MDVEREVCELLRPFGITKWKTDPEYLELLAQYPLMKRPASVRFMEIMLQHIRSKQA